MGVPAREPEGMALAPPPREERVFMRLFSFGRPSFVPSRPVFEPPVDVYETESEVVVIMEVAGADGKPEVHYEAATQELVIRGRRRDPAEGIPRNYHQLEVVYGTFERVLWIPVPVDNDRSTATYKDGFLRIRLPKAPARPRTYRIEIE